MHLIIYLIGVLIICIGIVVGVTVLLRRSKNSDQFRKPITKEGPLIPKLIHQTFSKPSELSNAFKYIIKKNKELNPEYKYKLYSDNDHQTYIRKNYGSRMLAIYNLINSEYGAARADFFRYLVIYKEGGVYLDIKSSTSIPLRDIILADDEYLLSSWGQTWSDRILNTSFGEYAQWFIIAIPKHPFLKAVINHCIKNILSYSASPLKASNLNKCFQNSDWSWGTTGKNAVLATTGPLAYTMAIYPIHNQYKHRSSDNLFDGKLIYSAMPGPKIDQWQGMIHEKEFKGHYSQLTTPIILNNKFRKAAGKNIKKYLL